ncbi:Asparagine--tRNA ligase [Buchnera aphidicola (Neophyllaphis podocarpi)]|uniref:asparagine--tRNA ligase n=1 Tax=Buchnera aphidicola TaxID=9 RepID=UPI003463CF90
MKVITIKDIYQGNFNLNSDIIINGWVRTKRDSKIGISFINLYDGSCLNTIQIISKNTLNNYYSEIINITTGCSLTVKGKIINSLGNLQKYEILSKEIKIAGSVFNPNTYPISSKKHTLEYLREVAHLRPRTNIIGSISRVRNTLNYYLHKFLHRKGFFWVPTPIITSINTEGAGDTFSVSSSSQKTKNDYNFNHGIYKDNFFGKKTFLTVSGQLNLEAYACALSNVYSFGPTFRAENSNTSRHLSEFWMLELEIAFSDLNHIIIFVELFLKYLFNILLKKCKDELIFFSEYTNINLLDKLEQSLEYNFIQIDYCEVIEILNNANVNFNNKKILFGDDLSSEQEKYICEQHFKKIVFIKNFPKSMKAFYMRLNDDNKTVASMDLLVPRVGELIGGSQREERLTELDDRIKELGLKKEDYWWYRDLRVYGTVPHSGFGLGFERLLSYVTGIKNIKDIAPFPRTIHNANF